MPVSYIPSAETKQKQTAKKRRRNQNTEIDELATLLPIKQQATIANGILAKGRTQSIDKLSVLRLTTAYLKFQKFLKNDKSKGKAPPTDRPADTTSLFSEALDGFLIVLDSDGFILYVSDSITNVVGLTQHDVIGQNFIDIVEEDDASTITDNLESKTTPPATHLDGRTEFQHRQFYVRIKSSVSPGKMQLSRFTSHVMIQVTGNLKVHVPFQSLMDPQKNGTLDSQVLGFVGECRPIESTSSILEVSVPQSHFTSTINLDMKIISVEASVKDVVGYDPADFIGTTMSDYFHPGDCKKMIKCEKTLMRLGHAVSPVFRFATSSGEWVWVQLEGMLRYKQGGVEPQFWEVKAKLLSQDDGKMKYVEYREMYAKSCDLNQDLLSPHKDPVVTNCLMDTENRCRKEKGAKPIIDSLKEAQVSSALIDPILHCRELGLSCLPANMKPVLTENEADDFVIRRNKELGWPVPDNLQERAKFLEKMSQILSSNSPGSVPLHNSPPESTMPQPSSTLSSVLPHKPVQKNVYQPQASSNVHSPFDSSPVDSNFASSNSVGSSHSLLSPPDSFLSVDQYSSYQSPLSTSVVSPPSVASSLSSNPSVLNTGLTDVAMLGVNSLNLPDAPNTVNFDPSIQNALSFMSQNIAPTQNAFDSNTSTYAHHNTVDTSQTIPYTGLLHDYTTHTHLLGQSTSLSSLASSAPSPQGSSIIPSPLSDPISPEQTLASPEINSHSNFLDGTPISPEQVFQSTENDSLEQILSDMISINQGMPNEGEVISVDCQVHSNGDVRGYGDSGISVGNLEAADVIQQFLA